jgi:hypothetical protein
MALQFRVQFRAEESPMLNFVTRKRLLKTLQAGEDVVFAEVI